MLSIFVVNSFVQLAPQVLKLPSVEYLLSEVFSQRGVLTKPSGAVLCSSATQRREQYDNPTAHQIPLNAVTLLQQQAVYKDLKTMNAEAAGTNNSSAEASQPLRKCARRKQNLTISQ